MYLNNHSRNRYKPKVAVLLTAYNGMKWIKEQIDSILIQEGVDVTIFISVDLSTDGTFEWCKLLENSYKSIVVLPYGDRFGGAARNFFRLIRDVDIAAYDFIAFADQDDIWDPQKLCHAVFLMEKYKCQAISSDVIAFWENGKEKLVKKSWHQKKYDYLFEAAGPGCTYVFRTGALSDFKIFLLSNWTRVNEVNLHDWLIYAYFRDRGLTWYIDNTPLLRYRQHSSNQVGFNSGIRAYLKRFFLIKNRWYHKEVEKISSLLGVRISVNFWFRIRNFLQLRRRTRDAIVLLAMSAFGIY